MFLRIDLLDNEEKVHRDVLLKFQAKTTIEQLKEKIESSFEIPPEKQQIFGSNDRRIHVLVGTLEDAGIQDNEHLILKHADLSVWIAFNRHFDLAKQYLSRKREHKVKEEVKLAFKRLTILEKNNFFIAYSEFDSRRQEFSENYEPFLDCDDDQLKNAAVLYFLRLFKDDPLKPSTQVVFSPKPNPGVQGGFICSVKRSEEILGNYFLKPHLGFSKMASGNQPVDLCELLIYKLLYLVEIGPEVHFLPNAHTSPSGLYIATKEVPSFRIAGTKNLVMPTSECYKLDILRAIFHLRDLYSNFNNYGLDGNDKLCIVDFHIGDYKRSIRSSVISDLRSKERFEVYKTSMEEWKLAEVVKKADEEISCQKLQFKTDLIASGASKNYTDYLEKISENIQFVSQSLGVPC
ncbi:hypothetical protein M3Y95_01162800 [Aphelenchoides besseyi]|nr:hypothetical protein M3Y95_01162800 [Aphelenchoides besseyi]